MQERIVEIIMYLMNELRSNKKLSDIDVSSLEHDGYTQTEITTAFTWILEQLLSEREYIQGHTIRSNSIRQLNEYEKRTLKPEAYGYLLQCFQLGLLTNDDIEEILEQIVIAGFSTIGLPEIKMVVAGILLGNDRNDQSSNLNTNETIH